MPLFKSLRLRMLYCFQNLNYIFSPKVSKDRKSERDLLCFNKSFRISDLRSFRLLIYKSLRNWLIRIYSAISQEGPVCSEEISLSCVNFYNSYFFFIMRCLIYQGAKWIAYKRATPEFHCTILLKPNTIHTHHMYCICNGMTSLNSLPCIVLFSIGCFVL